MDTSNHLLINIAKDVMNLADKLPLHEVSLSNRLRDRSLEVIEDGFLYLSTKEHVFLHKKEFLPQLLAKVNVLSALVSVVNERKYFEEEILKKIYEDINTFAKELNSGLEFNTSNVSVEQKTHLVTPNPVTSPGATSKQHYVNETKTGYPQPQVSELPIAQAVAVSSVDNSIAQTMTNEAPGTPHPLASGQAVSVVWKSGGIATKGWNFNEGLLPDRQRHIFILMREKRRSSLKEICQVFPNLSEKTIRNDLNILCERGLIQRVGVAQRSYYITA